jgi:fructose-1,6-bisphosphatase/inositol monophosphatase family enzyme
MDHWQRRFERLCDALRAAAREHLDGSLPGERGSAQRPVHAGAGDVAYAVDLACERAVDAWVDTVAREQPLSLLTEDTGWRHFGPDPRGAAARPVVLPGFDHGGPRIALDPVDGTRNLMADLRSAWTVVSVAPAGRGVPRLAELELGLVSEIPTSGAARFRRLAARRGAGALLETFELGSDEPRESRALAATHDDRPDHGYFPFFRYLPSEREAIARAEADFFAQLALHEGADPRTCFDDQYISNAGQLVLLALGTYRMVVDVRGLAGTRQGRKAVTAKPYDLAGAVLVAREAGCIVDAPDGSELDFPIDCTTPVDFVGWTNAATRTRLGHHLARALACL